MANPTGKGGFQPGQSGNPTGRPKTAAAFREACAAKTPEAVDELWKLASSSKSQMVKLEALKYLMNQAHGAPSQAVKLSGDPDEPLRLQLAAFEAVGSLLDTLAAKKAADADAPGTGGASA